MVAASVFRGRTLMMAPSSRQRSSTMGSQRSLLRRSPEYPRSRMGLAGSRSSSQRMAMAVA